MKMAKAIEDRLNDAFLPRELDVIDESAKHAGHAGNPGGDGETHFHVRMRADAMAGKSRLARHRAVHAALGGIVAEIHALSLDLDE